MTPAVKPSTLLVSLLLCLLPIAELRGGLPYALAGGVPPLAAYLLCVAANALVGPLVFLFLSSLHRLLDRWPAYHRFFVRLVDRSRRRIHSVVERYGYWGLMIFVAIPLPLTGAYTGALGAWVLGMRRWKSVLFITLGVALAGLIVSLVYLLGLRALYFLLKK
jgi:uncharacterized membrane protein